MINRDLRASSHRISVRRQIDRYLLTPGAVLERVRPEGLLCRVDVVTGCCRERSSRSLRGSKTVAIRPELASYSDAS